MIENKLMTNKNIVLDVCGRQRSTAYSICIDTRSIKKGEAFIALKGDTFDAFNYLEDVIAKGGEVIVYNRNDDNDRVIQVLAKANSHIQFIGVENTLKYLQQISKIHILKLKKGKLKNIIGITGSNGKTTTKNILNHLLDAILKDKLTCTKGNFNNHIGVPLTLLKINEHHETAIVEMGTNHPGEIDFLCDLALPNAGIITNIGDAHLEFLKSKEGVLQEKKSLFNRVMKNTNNKGNFIINGDDPYLTSLSLKKNVVYVGKTQKNISFYDHGLDIFINNKMQLKNNYLTGEHNFYNLAMAFMMAFKIYPEQKNELIKAVESFRPSSNRSEWVKEGNNKIFMDAYNANPSSMLASLRGFFSQCKNQQVSLDQICLILGDMMELGEQAEELHCEIGQYIKEQGIQKAIFVGQYADYYQQGFAGSSNKYLNVHQLLDDWIKIKKNHDYFFIKGSRSLQLELLMDIT